VFIDDGTFNLSFFFFFFFFYRTGTTEWTTFRHGRRFPARTNDFSENSLTSEGEMEGDPSAKRNVASPVTKFAIARKTRRPPRIACPIKREYDTPPLLVPCLFISSSGIERHNDGPSILLLTKNRPADSAA